MSNLYQTLANDLARGIEAGIYKADEKMPSIRATSTDHNISPATAVAAYRQLELDGYLEAKPRSGFFVKARKRAKIAEPEQGKLSRKRPSLVNSQEWVLNMVETVGNPDVVQFGAAVTDASFLPARAVEQAISKTSRLNRQKVCDYELPVGSLVLREQIAKRMTDIGCFTEAEDIIVTNGCQEAVFIALKAITKPGDVIVIESPTFHGHLQVAESLGLKVLEIPSHPRTGISIDALKLALDQWQVKACLVIPNFSNPLGACMPDSNKKTLVKMMSHHKVSLIEDDIYGDLAFNQKRPSVLKTYDKLGEVIYCSSFSKTLAPGLRIGWIIPGNFFRQVSYQKFITSVASNSIAQLAIADLMASGRFTKHLRLMRTKLETAVNKVSEAISQHFPAGTKITKPLGGYVIWVELPAKVNTVDLAKAAIIQNISIAPGPIFSASGKYTNFMRISCGVKWGAQAENAVVTLGNLIAEQLSAT